MYKTFKSRVFLEKWWNLEVNNFSRSKRRIM